MQHLKIRGLWSPLEAVRHITLLEVETVFLALKAFQAQVNGKTVLIQTDHTTTMIYLTKQRQARSYPLSKLTKGLWKCDSANDNTGGDKPTTHPKHGSRQVKQTGKCIPQMGNKATIARKYFTQMGHPRPRTACKPIERKMTKLCIQVSTPTFQRKCPFD
mgnify:CR=1 FL=1